MCSTKFYFSLDPIMRKSGGGGNRNRTNYCCSICPGDAMDTECVEYKLPPAEYPNFKPALCKVAFEDFISAD